MTREARWDCAAARVAEGGAEVTGETFRLGGKQVARFASRAGALRRLREFKALHPQWAMSRVVVVVRAAKEQGGER